MIQKGFPPFCYGNNPLAYHGKPLNNEVKCVISPLLAAPDKIADRNNESFLNSATTSSTIVCQTGSPTSK